MGKKLILFPVTAEDKPATQWHPRIAAGSLESYASQPSDAHPGFLEKCIYGTSTLWVPKREWTGHLTIMGYSRGRSAAGWQLRAADDTEYYMFMTDLMDCIKRLTITAGMMYGRWEFIKRGANYGVRLVPDA